MDNNKQSDNEKGLQQSRSRINADFLAEIKKAEKEAATKNNESTKSKQIVFEKIFLIKSINLILKNSIVYNGYYFFNVLSLFIRLLIKFKN